MRGPLHVRDRCLCVAFAAFIAAPSLAGRLMFRPAQEPGTFLIRGLEVRLVGD